MTALHEQLVELNHGSLDVLIDQHAEPVTVTPQVGQSVPVDAVVEAEKVRREQDQTGLSISYERRISLDISQLSAIPENARVVVGVTIGDLTYSVESLSRDGSMLTYMLVRSAVREMSRPQYRGSR